MSTDYPAGTVAIATVRGIEGVRVMRCEMGQWMSHVLIKGARYHFDDLVTDVRPLVVLDFTPNPSHVADLLRILRENFWADIADQIEAQTKPSRIPEPGLWGVVKAKVAFEGDVLEANFVNHDHAGAPSKTWHDAGGSWWHWSDLVDPTLIREGVES